LRCERCGGKGTFVQKLLSDGMEKKIVFCQACLEDTLRNHVSHLKSAGLELFEIHKKMVEDSPAMIGGEFRQGHYHIQIIVPVLIQATLFESDEFTDLRLKKAMVERELAYWSRKLQENLKKERFEEAAWIKEKMKVLEAYLKRSFGVRE